MMLPREKSPIMRHFLACSNLGKNLSFTQYFYGPRDNPLLHMKFKFYCQKSSKRVYILSQNAPIFGPWTHNDMFWNFCTWVYINPTAFYRV